MKRKEGILRGLALLLGLAWFAGLVLVVSQASSSEPASSIAAIFGLAAYVGGPMVAFLLDKHLGAGHGCAWSIAAFLIPMFVLPFLALWKIRSSLSNVTRLREKGDVVGLLRALQRHKPAYVRSNAARALAEIGDAYVVAQLVDSLGYQGGTVQAAAADALGQIAARPGGASLCEPAVALLITALGNENPEVRSAAARALGHTGHPQAVPPPPRRPQGPHPPGTADGGEVTVRALTNSLDDRVLEVRRQAVLALGRACTQSPDASQQASATIALASRLEDPDAGIRQYAAEMLGLLGDTRAVDFLLPLLEDGEARVRAGAALALGQIGDGHAREALGQRLQDASTHVRQCASDALNQIGGTATQATSAVAL